MAPGCHDIPFTKSHTPLAPIGLLEKASFSRLSRLSMGRICLYTSIAARGGGGSFKRLKLYNSEETFAYRIVCDNLDSLNIFF